MNVLSLLKMLAPMLVSALREYSKSTETKIDDIGVNTIEFILKQFGILK